MIEVTRLDNSKMFINVEMIQSLKETPDTVITFTTKGTLIVKEPAKEISDKIIEYQRSIHKGLYDPAGDYDLTYFSTKEDVKDMKIKEIVTL